MAETLIFLDMDGVLTRWDDYAALATRDIPEEARADFYHTLGHDWWASIPAYEGTREFYDALSAVGHVRFLTGVKLEPGCYSGKAQWIMNLAPERGISILKDFMPCASTDKKLLAAPGRILIDDRIANIKDWQEAGGIGILHQGDFQDTIRRVIAAAAPQNALQAAPPGPSPS